MHIMLDDGKSESPVKLLLLCVAAVLIPWVWGVWAMPVWVALVSLVFSAISVLLFYWQIKRHTDRVQLLEVTAQSVQRKHADEVSDSAAMLRSILSQWLDASQTASGNLQQARAMLDEVTEQSEAAAVNIGKSFRLVMNKTGQQMDDAVRLLKSNSGSAGGTAWLSLPDFIKAYANQLNAVTDRMMDFSKASEEMSRHQAAVSEHSVAIDEMLDELRTLAARVRKLALDSAVVSNRDSTTDTHWFFEIAERIRETSTSAHELTRRMRDGLEQIREVMYKTYDELNKSGDNVRMAAVQAKVDVSQLNIATMEKAREVTGTLEKITSLGEEVRQDINQIIVAMQFQDITHQKLEHVKSPLMTTASASLATVAAKTRAAGIAQAAEAVESMGEASARAREDLLPGKARTADVELF